MDAAVATAIISAAVAVTGTVVTFVNRHEDRDDVRLDLAFRVNQELVDDLRVEREDLRTERAELVERVARLEGTVHDQGTQMDILHQREAELRAWTVEIMAWAAMAVGIIRSMGGTIDNPPGPPHGPNLVDVR